MLSYTIKRIVQIIPVMLVISLLVFLMMHMIPGDPVKNMMGLEASKEAVEAERERLGLNDPLPIQYMNFMKNVVKGDLGTSIFSKKSVTKEILDRYPYTAKLALGGTIFAAVVGVLAEPRLASQHRPKNAASLCTARHYAWYAVGRPHCQDDPLGDA